MCVTSLLSEGLLSRCHLPLREVETKSNGTGRFIFRSFVVPSNSGAVGLVVGGQLDTNVSVRSKSSHGGYGNAAGHCCDICSTKDCLGKRYGTAYDGNHGPEERDKNLAFGVYDVYGVERSGVYDTSTVLYDVYRGYDEQRGQNTAERCDRYNRQSGHDVCSGYNSFDSSYNAFDTCNAYIGYCGCQGYDGNGAFNANHSSYSNACNAYNRNNVYSRPDWISKHIENNGRRDVADGCNGINDGEKSGNNSSNSSSSSNDNNNIDDIVSRGSWNNETNNAKKDRSAGKEIENDWCNAYNAHDPNNAHVPRDRYYFPICTSAHSGRNVDNLCDVCAIDRAIALEQKYIEALEVSGINTLAYLMRQHQPRPIATQVLHDSGVPLNNNDSSPGIPVMSHASSDTFDLQNLPPPVLSNELDNRATPRRGARDPPTLRRFDQDSDTEASGPTATATTITTTTTTTTTTGTTGTTATSEYERPQPRDGSTRRKRTITSSTARTVRATRSTGNSEDSGKRKKTVTDPLLVNSFDIPPRTVIVLASSSTKNNRGQKRSLRNTLTRSLKHMSAVSRIYNNKVPRLLL